MRDSRLTRIGLLDHMGYGNLGDAAIQDSVIHNIRKRLPDAELVGFSLVPDDTRRRHGIPTHSIRWWYPKNTPPSTDTPANGLRARARLKSALKRQPLVYAWAKPLVDLLREGAFLLRSYRAVRRLDVLIISGGGQLCELWWGPWSHPYTVFKFAVLAKLARKKLYLLNVGAGPLDHPVSRFCARWAVRLADYRSFRDRDSQELLRGLGVSEITHVYPDPAYALPLDGDDRPTAPRAAMPVVGLNAIGFCDPRFWPRKDAVVYEEYLAKIVSFSRWLLAEGYDLRVFTTETTTDRYVIEDLRARLRPWLSSPETEQQVFRSPSQTVSEVLREMSEFDFVVTSKFHAIIFSHLLNKPVISLSYHRKMDFLMRAARQDRFCADIERFDVEWLISAFQSSVADAARIRSGYAALVAAHAARLSTQFDGLFGPARRRGALGSDAARRQPDTAAVVRR